MKKIIFLFLFFAEIANGQSLTFRQSIIQVCPDKDGNFLVLLSNGGIKKYSPDGALLASQKIKGVASIDASIHTRIFYFKKKKKRIGRLSPDLKFLEEKKISDLNALEPGLACAASMHEWWVADVASQKVRCINTDTDAVRVEFPIPENFDGKKMAYTGQYLFLSSTNKTFLYDFLGHLVKEFDGGNVNFLGQEFYFLQNKKVEFHDLYSPEARVIPIASQCTGVVFLENKMLELFHKKIIIRSGKQ